MTRTLSLPIIKDPASIEPQGIDWTDWLAELEGTELVVHSEWTVTGDDASLDVDDDSIVTGSRKTQVTLSGGTAGLTYRVTNHITTTSGYEDERTIVVNVKQR